MIAKNSKGNWETIFNYFMVNVNTIYSRDYCVNKQTKLKHSLSCEYLPIWM